MLSPYQPHCIEEPIGVDQPHAAWHSLAQASPVPLVAGENLRGAPAFVETIEAGYLRFVQPDVGKWGGITGGLAVTLRGTVPGHRLLPPLAGRRLGRSGRQPKPAARAGVSANGGGRLGHPV